MTEKIVLEDVQLLYRNFSGLEDQYNREGSRNFCVILTDKMAKDLSKAGFNVKARVAREEGDEDVPYLKINVSYRFFAPMVRMIGTATHRQTPLDEGLVGMLDNADIVSADVIFTPSEWGDEKRGGITAYLDTLYVNVNENPLELKYADVPQQRRPSE